MTCPRGGLGGYAHADVNTRPESCELIFSRPLTCKLGTEYLLEYSSTWHLNLVLNLCMHVHAVLLLTTAEINICFIYNISRQGLNSIHLPTYDIR